MYLFIYYFFEEEEEEKETDNTQYNPFFGCLYSDTFELNLPQKTRLLNRSNCYQIS